MFTNFARSTFCAALSVAAAATTVLATAPASAQSTVRTQEVRFADLDLTSAAGVTALDQRIDRATRSVCGVNGARTLQEITDARRCQKIALNDAAPRVQFAVAQARSNQGYASNEVKVRSGR